MQIPILFHIIKRRAVVPSGLTKWAAYLNQDVWDDWGKYCTQFYLTVVDAEGTQHGIGQVKIGQRGLSPHRATDELPPGHRKPSVPSTFEQLPEEFFSLGQDDEYYANLGKLGDEVREQVLKSLRDVAFDNEVWLWAQAEDVMGESLLRSVTRSTVLGQFRRMARGDARLTRFRFTYSSPKPQGEGDPPFRLDFSVDPESPIPTNVHVLIGRNGVGKTYILSLMARALTAADTQVRQFGEFLFYDSGNQLGRFANLVSVSFSAFDEAELLPEGKLGPNSFGYSYIGLQKWQARSQMARAKPKSPRTLAEEFVRSLGECQVGSRRRRWVDAIATLKSDPVFRAAQLPSMIEKDLSPSGDETREVKNTFRALSSGHKIVLLTLTRLVQEVEEKTLVLIDEPEVHLHPPLLSALTRALSELMVKRNGVAIMATHSPVILQEVPKCCVWILNRINDITKYERPVRETFGESVGVLSREVFQLELANSGYHQLLGKLRKRFTTYDEALDHLEGQLGAEGRAVLRAMYINYNE